MELGNKFHRFRLRGILTPAPFCIRDFRLMAALAGSYRLSSGFIIKCLQVTKTGTRTHVHRELLFQSVVIACDMMLMRMERDLKKCCTLRRRSCSRISFHMEANDVWPVGIFPRNFGPRW